LIRKWLKNKMSGLKPKQFFENQRFVFPIGRFIHF